MRENPFLSSPLALLAGQLSVAVGGIRPTEILGIHESVYEDLMLDIGMVGRALPESNGEGTGSVADGIRMRRRMSGYNYKVQRLLNARP